MSRSISAIWLPLWLVALALNCGEPMNGFCGPGKPIPSNGSAVAMLGNVSNASDGVLCGGYGHTGLNGASAANWNASYFATYAPGITDPGAVVILLGENDADNDAAAGNVFGVVDQALAMWPGVVPIVQTMFPTVSSNHTALNAGLRSRAATRPEVVLVEQANVFGGSTGLEYLSDGVHPNATGYAKLADALINAMIQRMTGPANVWCLGDSITHGAIWNGATFDYEGSYRCALYAALIAAFP